MFAVGAAELLIIVLVLLATVPGLVFQPRLALAIIALFAAPLLFGMQRAPLSSSAPFEHGHTIDPHLGVTAKKPAPTGQS
ncbi:MAG: hypothetical protein AAFU77_13560 [Myxococcota bacterium]